MPEGVTIIEGPAPKAPPAPTRELSVRDVANLPGGNDRPGGGSPDSSRTSLRKNLESKAKPAGEPTVTPTPVKEPPTAEQKAANEKAAAYKAAASKAADGQPADQQPAADGKPAGKANPWKLFDAEKKARAAAEQEVQRLKTSVVPEQERTAIMARVEKAEARAKELEDHIRFVSYEKSTEFKDQYQAPYEQAWKRATMELSEIAVVDPISGQQRAVTSQDILELVNLPLGKAREVADEMFGKFADDVMGHRKEIRGLFEKQNQALEDAKKNGGVREQQTREQYQKQQAALAQTVQQAWKEADEGFLSDKVNAQYFRPKTVEEGKEFTPEEKEWNEALERGFKLVDEAWGTNAMDPKLTPEQRAAAIKKNVAVRNRAAAFGPLKRLTKRLEAKIAQLEKDLQQYSGSTPNAGGSVPNGQVQTGKTAQQAFHDRLVKVAH